MTGPVNCPHGVAMDVFCEKCEPRSQPGTTDDARARGRHYDIIVEAIAEFDDWMKDDDFNPMPVLVKIINRMRERLEMSARPDPQLGVQNGYVTVPREPTQAMIAAAENAREAYSSFTYRDIYREMIGTALPEKAEGRATDEDHPDCTTDRERELYDALMGLSSAITARQGWSKWVQGGVQIAPIVRKALRLDAAPSLSSAPRAGVLSASDQLSKLWNAIVENTKGDGFWLGEILLSEITKETGFKPPSATPTTASFCGETHCTYEDGWCKCGMVGSNREQAMTDHPQLQPVSAYTDQPIFDAIVAATSHSLFLAAGTITIDTDKFIQAFNSHRDRALCTSLDRPAQCGVLSESDEFAWLIEHGDSDASKPRYWAAGQTDANRSSAWTFNHMEAIRFARKLDAEKVVRRIMKGIPVRIAEHGWPSLSSAHQSSPAASRASTRATTRPPASCGHGPECRG